MHGKHLEEIFTWEAPEFRHYLKDFYWYWASLLVTAVLFALSLWQGNFLFAVFVVIAEFIVIRSGNEPPKSVRFSITKQGVQVGTHRLYTYDTLLGFAASDEPDGLSELFLQSKNKFSPVVKLHAYSYELEKIKTTLGEFLPELEYEETPFDAIAKIIRF